MIGAPAGFVVPLGLFAILDLVLSPDAFLAWGWRVPFLLSVMLVIIGLYIRLNLTESPMFAKLRKEVAGADVRSPLVGVVKDHFATVWGCCAKLAESTTFTTFAVIIVGYAVSQGLPRQLIVW
jgi:hypothetical protein